jgi:pimeloyl-ACP methyl ester carboxylesterase
VPVLVVHGDADQILPSDKTGARLAGLLNDLELVVVEGRSHAIVWDARRPGRAPLPGFLCS